MSPTTTTNWHDIRAKRPGERVTQSGYALANERRLAARVESLSDDMPWTVEAVAEIERWLVGLSPKHFAAASANLDALAARGPALGRPFVCDIPASHHENMKELRSVHRIRILFVFDPERRKIVLVGGDAPATWLKWYIRNREIADDRYDRYLRETADL